jgi:hypothetical protein
VSAGRDAHSITCPLPGSYASREIKRERTMSAAFFSILLIALRKKGTDIGIELRVAKLGFEVLLKLGARHVMAATLHVFRKGMNDPARIGRGHFERRGEVEQVTALYTLVKRAAWFRASDSVEFVPT